MIFVSHRESDARVAKALVDFLTASLEIADSKIRCSSVPGYQLPFGNTVAGQLKRDIHASNAVFVLLTRDSLESPWVLFELGASWALGKVMIPILGRGVSLNDVPGPLREYPVVAVETPNAAARLRDATAQIAQELGIVERGGGKAQSELENLLRCLHDWKPTLPAGIAPARAFQVSWLMMTLCMKQARHPSAAEAEIEQHAKELELNLPPGWRKKVRDPAGEKLQEVVGHLGGQLAARQPQLLPYFEAGFNVVVGASREGPEGIRRAISHLNLPAAVSEAQGDALAWANAIQAYFEDALRGMEK